MTVTETHHPAEPGTDHAIGTAPAPSGPAGRIGRIVTLTMVGGFLLATLLVAVPFAGAEEHVITGSVLIAFAGAWAVLAWLSTKRTDQPQGWAAVPAAVMAAAGLTIVTLAPTGNQLGWVWPPAMVALVAWMIIRARHQLRSRARTVILYPVFAALALSALGGAYETYRETTDPSASAMPGRLVDVGGHKLHISCTGSGSPTVVLEPGLGELSAVMAGWIAPDVAAMTRVCVYDRAGRGWSEAADGPQDGTQVATALHTLLARAGEPGPYVLAGHSLGGIHVLNFARLFPEDVAGIALLDSMHPEQYTRMSSWPGFYEMYRRVSAVAPTLARLGIGRVVYGAAYSDLPAAQRAQARAFLATPRSNRSTRDEFNRIRTAMNQAAQLTSLGDRPLSIVTAQHDADPDWSAMQDDLATLSTDTVHRSLPNATHTMVVQNEGAARQSSRAILDIVDAVRKGTPINGQEA